jgi:hypothetical protein
VSANAVVGTRLVASAVASVGRGLVPRRLCLALLLALLCLPSPGAPLTVARLKYGGGGDWYCNPTGLPNLIKAVNQRTSIKLAPEPAVVEPGSQRIFDYPILFVTGHGRIAFTPSERENLRRYVAGGGFIHVDDCYGLDESLRPELKKLFPDSPLAELPFGHTIYHCLFAFPGGLPKIHEHHGGPPHGYGIIQNGRVVLFYSYNTDINDGWEDYEVHKDPPEKHEASLRMGVNIVVYALTH